MEDLTIVYYTANRVRRRLRDAVIKQLKEAAGGAPIISVSQKPVRLGQNICVGEFGYSVWGVYWQMLQGAREAKTKYVAAAEDDILYSFEHFHSERPPPGKFLYDLNRWMLFTWGDPQFSYKPNRLLAYTLIAERDLLVEALEERFEKCPSPADAIEKLFGEPGRKEAELGVTVREVETFMAGVPSVCFQHDRSIGFRGQGYRKAHGPYRTHWLLGWGWANDVLRQYYG